MAIIGVSGKIGSGKDTVGKIIQVLTHIQNSENSFNKVFLESELDVCIKNNFSNDIYTKNSTWQIKKFAGKLKQIVSLLTGIPVEDLEKQEVKDRVLGKEWQVIPYENTFYTKRTVRWLLQKLGTDAMRDVIHPNIWVNALFADYKDEWGGMNTYTNTGKYPNWIITDVRFPNEADAILERGGIMLRVNRGKINPCSAHDQHISETALDNYSKFNFIIDNNGTIEELVPKIKDVLQKIKTI